MKKTLLLILAILTMQVSLAQKEQAYQSGEWFKFRMSYSGWLKAGNATMSVEETTYKGKQVYHVVGKGWTTGAIKWFFKVKDTYESYFDTGKPKPYLFKRDVYEGGHIIKRNISFDYEKDTATIEDFKYKTIKKMPFANVQDMISAFYYLRNVDIDTIKVGLSLIHI